MEILMIARTELVELAPVASLCRRNALHVVRLAWQTHPDVGFDQIGVLWLDGYIDASLDALDGDMLDEFVLLMGCFYGECLIAAFDGTWAWSGEHLGVRMDRLGFTYPFKAIEKQIEVGPARSVAMSFLTAVEYLGDAA